MEISTKLIKQLANLSRLKFTDTEIESFKGEFGKTMEYVDTLQKIDTSSVERNIRTLDAKTELRSDEVQTSLTQAEVIKEAPEKNSGMISVPKMVD